MQQRHYIRSKILVLINTVIFYSKYSDTKLGGPNDVPEYSDISWFAMQMAAGMGNGMFFFPVFETVHHYTSRNKFSSDPTLPDNELAQAALMLQFFHLGIIYLRGH